MSTAKSRDRRRVVARTGASVLGLILIIAAVGKAVDPVAFAEQIAHEGLDLIVPAAIVAWAVIVVEVLLGLALLLGLRTRSVLAASGGLIAVFLMLTGRAYWRWLSGVELVGPDCGCFGNLVARTPAQAFWQDLALLVPGYAASWLDVVPEGVRRRAGRWGVTVAATAIAGVFTALAPRLPLDDLATVLEPGVDITELCSGPRSRDDSETACLDLVVPELLEGSHLAVIADLDSGELAAAVPALNALAGSGGRRVWLLSDAPRERQQTFFWEHGPLFEIREVPISLLRPLYRSLPRSFSVDDGRVVETISGLPDGGERHAE